MKDKTTLETKVEHWLESSIQFFFPIEKFTDLFENLFILFCSNTPKKEIVCCVDVSGRSNFFPLNDLRTLRAPLLRSDDDDDNITFDTLIMYVKRIEYGPIPHPILPNHQYF